MLKSKREREQYLKDPKNWELVMQDKDIFISVHKTLLPNGEILVRITYITELPEGDVVESNTYNWLLENGVSVPWRYADLIDYLSQV